LYPAELYGKLGTTLARNEDVLTSHAFGFLIVKAQGEC